MRARIAIVEDEPDLRDAVAEYLGANGYEVFQAEDAKAMRLLVEQHSFQLAILDIAMPGEDGLALGRWLRSKMPIGIIYATASGTALDRIVGLELGADDYMVKPYELRELLARVRSVLRRVPNTDETPLKYEIDSPRRIVPFGPYTADLEGRLVIRGDGSVLDLAKSEFDVLEVFLLRPNRLLSRANIAEAIGLVEETEASRAIDIRIMRLRKKIENDPASPRFLRTVRGEGYIFSPSIA
ncbi:response regulator [Oryzicola mucosus]|uniref:Response regulator transcription factor n=1 Tax=Oryzicola mucosus TaxID=2767425 RepID=A0A8J6PH16_9HYPH|nr:response regulator transcription factor [Oryzicola mucosus]MBD0413226.1 response regulator transcription factor [Oryzicola mucosus]